MAKQKVVRQLQITKAFCKTHKKLLIVLCGTAIVLGIVILLICYLLIGSYAKYVLPEGNHKHIRIGIVLGSGITSQGKPFRELQARLDMAAMALDGGSVDKLILSGDNRFKNYNEPDAMVTYLTEVKHIPASKLLADYAGRSTYESCERAAKVFGVKQAVIFSANSHLPRAIFLCRKFGVEAFGISSKVEANNSQRRELVARAKAVFNVYIYGENTIIGAPIRL